MSNELLAILFGIAVVAIVLRMRARTRRAESKILELLADGREWRGLELVQASGGILKRGTIYVHLTHLELDSKLITSREPVPGYRRVYRLVSTGRDK